MIELDGFTIEVAASLGGVTRDMLANWDRSGSSLPSVPAKRSRRRSASTASATSSRSASSASSARRASPHQALRKVVEYLCARTGLTPTEAIAATNLITDGHDVYEVNGDVSVSTLRRPGNACS